MVEREPAPRPPKGFRPHMPESVKKQAALYAAGFTDDDAVEWDHDPALQLRIWDEEAGDTIPRANDPRYIVPRRKADHSRKTNGTKATTAGSDKNRIAKANHLSAAHEAFQRAMSVPAFKRKEDKPRSKWGSRPLRSRNTFKDRRRG